ncbi:hypothetical protein [Pedobacter hiemivivus]|uniref:hypothetical protein n=1 Tax=Pedobacter hiemivivus TaxID=2530454 RepID=UPI0013F1794E|nr:hypothetical protein [Pedobacter hiemivivus]
MHTKNRKNDLELKSRYLKVSRFRYDQFPGIKGRIDLEGTNERKGERVIEPGWGAA